MVMQLYGDPASPYVTRVILFARLKGLILGRPPVPGDNPRSAAYHQLNPIGKVPGLMVDGRMVPESAVICDYLEDAFPEPAGLPAAPFDRATSRLVARITDLYISPQFQPLLPHLDPARRDPAAVVPLAAELDKAFRSLAYFMGPGPFCVAGEPTLGDCTLGPYMQLLKNVIFPVFDSIPDPTVGEGRLVHWWQALQGHALCREELDAYGEVVDVFMAANRERLHEHR